MLQSPQYEVDIDPISLDSEVPDNEFEKTACTVIWDSIMNEVKAQLRAMPSDECYTRALELQTIARSEVDCRIPRASAGLLAKAPAQPIIVEPSNPWTPVAFVPISPMKSSRKYQTAAKSPCRYTRYPSYQHMYPPPPSGQELLHPTCWPYPWHIPMTHSPSDRSPMPQEILKQSESDSSQSKSDGSFVTDQGPVTITCQPTSTGLQGSSIRVASNWSEIRSITEPRTQTKSKAKKKAQDTMSKVSGAEKKRKVKGMPDGTTQFDVLCGRGGGAFHHAGNVRFRDEVRKMKEVYQDTNTSREKKPLLSQELIKRVHGYGGRFLKKGSDGVWHDMCAKDAREKASQALREKKWV